MSADGPETGPDQGKSANRRGAGARLYRGSVRALSLVFLGVGGVLLVTTLVNGGGPASVGVLLGIAFVAVGAGRLWLAARTST
jgi:hypothetical protein